MTEAEKYLNENGLEREFNNIEITFQGMVDHLNMFLYEQTKLKNHGVIGDVRLSLPDADEITEAAIEYAELPDECTLDDERLNDCKHFIGGATWYHKRIKGNEA